MPDRTQGDDAARRVDALRRRYELTEAETLARRSLDQNGDDPGLLIAWGRLLLATHRPDQALATFRRAEELDADHPRAVAWQIATLSRDRRTADAATLAETALRRFPTSALVHVAAGRALLDSSRPQDAVRHFADADGTLAAEEVCLCWQAAALVGVSASAEAEALLRAHLAKDPAAVKARYRLGRVLLHDDRPAEALECFDAVLDACPDHDDALCRKVEALRRARRFSEAEAFAEEAMERLPGCPGLHTELAWVLSAQDREDE
ncbi:tetratricopeptide repeat protein, partial [Nonomuraea sp. NPDC049419]|uniref:tetratricopeptide repeat protein n=1 Tax=Nonomuraea sp. NPDC049419 TaxID=3155772 RepID=UPI0034377653